MILLDTHTLIWLDEGNPRLGKNALKQIDDALKESSLYIATISYWEIAMLNKKQRIDMAIPVEIWRRNLLSNGLLEITLSANIAFKPAQLENFHGDPADRIITATALTTNAKLCTADQKILEWKHKLSLLSATD